MVWAKYALFKCLNPLCTAMTNVSISAGVPVAGSQPFASPPLRAANFLHPAALGTYGGGMALSR